MALTAADWTARAEAAETALNDLMLGSRVVELYSPDGTKIRYQEADQTKLEEYIGYCRRQAQAASSVPSPIYILP